MSTVSLIAAGLRYYPRGPLLSPEVERDLGTEILSDFGDGRERRRALAEKVRRARACEVNGEWTTVHCSSFATNASTATSCEECPPSMARAEEASGVHPAGAIRCSPGMKWKRRVVRLFEELRSAKLLMPSGDERMEGLLRSLSSARLPAICGKKAVMTVMTELRTIADECRLTVSDISHLDPVMGGMLEHWRCELCRCSLLSAIAIARLSAAGVGGGTKSLSRLFEWRLDKRDSSSHYRASRTGVLFPVHR